MKVIQLDIEGFRSLRKVSWKPGDLNVLIGPNGTGKSNLLRFLELMSVSAQGRLGKYIQSLGGMDAIVWDGQVSNISFSLMSSPIEIPALIEGNIEPQLDAMDYTLKIVRLGQSNAYRIQSEIAKYHPFQCRRSEDPFQYFQRDERSAQIFMQKGPISPIEAISEEETLLSTMSTPFVIGRLLPFFRHQLASWTIYHDLRVDKDAPIRQAAIKRLEKRVDADGQNLVSVLHTLYTSDRYFKRDINDAMYAAFGDDFEGLIFSPAADSRIQLRVQWKSLKRAQSTADLSDGTLRFLLLLTILASPSPPSLIAIDEPETGLYPTMLPIVAEFARDAAGRTQVIFTTHSSQFLNGFTEFKPTMTVAKWENGETHLVTLDRKELDYWMEKYPLGDLYESGELENMA